MESQTSANPKLQDIKDQSYNMNDSKQVLVVFEVHFIFKIKYFIRVIKISSNSPIIPEHLAS